MGTLISELEVLEREYSASGVKTRWQALEANQRKDEREKPHDGIKSKQLVVHIWMPTPRKNIHSRRSTSA